MGVRPRRETRGRREAAAREAANIVTDADVASHVLGFLSVAVGGWCAALWSAGAVCKAWRDGVKALRPALEEWTEFRWEVEKISLLQTQPTTRIYSPPFTSGAGSYEWRLLMCVQRDLPGDEDDENETQHVRAERANPRLLQPLPQAEVPRFDPRSSSSRVTCAYTCLRRATRLAKAAAAARRSSSGRRSSVRLLPSCFSSRLPGASRPALPKVCGSGSRLCRTAGA
jgi:hypothetical protein